LEAKNQDKVDSRAPASFHPRRHSARH